MQAEGELSRLTLNPEAQALETRGPKDLNRQRAHSGRPNRAYLTKNPKPKNKKTAMNPEP